jgi:hypothetical protein
MKFTKKYLEQEAAYCKVEEEAFWKNPSEENRKVVLNKREEFAKLQPAGNQALTKQEFFKHLEQMIDQIIADNPEQTFWRKA